MSNEKFPDEKTPQESLSQSSLSPESDFLLHLFLRITVDLYRRVDFYKFLLSEIARELGLPESKLQELYKRAGFRHSLFYYTREHQLFEEKLLRFVKDTAKELE